MSFLNLRVSVNNDEKVAFERVKMANNNFAVAYSKELERAIEFINDFYSRVIPYRDIEPKRQFATDTILETKSLMLIDDTYIFKMVFSGNEKPQTVVILPESEL